MSARVIAALIVVAYIPIGAVIALLDRPLARKRAEKANGIQFLALMSPDKWLVAESVKKQTAWTIFGWPLVVPLRIAWFLILTAFKSFLAFMGLFLGSPGWITERIAEHESSRDSLNPKRKPWD